MNPREGGKKLSTLVAMPEACAVSRSLSKFLALAWNSMPASTELRAAAAARRSALAAMQASRRACRRVQGCLRIHLSWSDVYRVVWGCIFQGQGDRSTLELSTCHLHMKKGTMSSIMQIILECSLEGVDTVSLPKFGLFSATKNVVTAARQCKPCSRSGPYLSRSDCHSASRHCTPLQRKIGRPAGAY